MLLLLTVAGVFAQNNNPGETAAKPAWRRFTSGSVSIRLDEFLLYAGKQSEMSEMIAHEFDMPGFEPYYGGNLPAPASGGENYYVFKTTFSVSADCMDKDISLYIDPLSEFSIAEYNYREAFVLFVSLMKSYPNDRVTKLYAGQCKAFIKTQPPPDWDAVKNLSEK